MSEIIRLQWCICRRGIGSGFLPETILLWYLRTRLMPRLAAGAAGRRVPAGEALVIRLRLPHLEILPPLADALLFAGGLVVLHQAVFGHFMGLFIPSGKSFVPWQCASPPMKRAAHPRGCAAL